MSTTKKTKLFTLIALLVAFVLLLIAVISFTLAYFSATTDDADLTTNLNVNILFGRLDDDQPTSGIWGTENNPYLIYNQKHLNNLYRLQNTKNRNFINEDTVFQVSNPDGTACYVGGDTPSTPMEISSIGSEDFPFTSTLRGVSGTVEFDCADGTHTSDTSVLGNLKVLAYVGQVDIGLFGFVGGTSDQSKGAITDLLLADITIETSSVGDTEKKTEDDASFIHDDDTYQGKGDTHETNHIGVLAGHAQYCSINNISVYYSTNTRAFNITAASTAKYTSAGGIIGFYRDIDVKGGAVSSDTNDINDVRGGDATSGSGTGIFHADTLWDMTDGNQPSYDLQDSFDNSNLYVDYNGNPLSTNTYFQNGVFTFVHSRQALSKDRLEKLWTGGETIKIANTDSADNYDKSGSDPISTTKYYMHQITSVNERLSGNYRIMIVATNSDGKDVALRKNGTAADPTEITLTSENRTVTTYTRTTSNPYYATASAPVYSTIIPHDSDNNPLIEYYSFENPNACSNYTSTSSSDYGWGGEPTTATVTNATGGASSNNQSYYYGRTSVQDDRRRLRFFNIGTNNLDAAFQNPDGTADVSTQAYQVTASGYSGYFALRRYNGSSAQGFLSYNVSSNSYTAINSNTPTANNGNYFKLYAVYTDAIEEERENTPDGTKYYMHKVNSVNERLSSNYRLMIVAEGNDGNYVLTQNGTTAQATPLTLNQEEKTITTYSRANNSNTHTMVQTGVPVLSAALSGDINSYSFAPPSSASSYYSGNGWAGSIAWVTLSSVTYLANNANVNFVYNNYLQIASTSSGFNSSAQSIRAFSGGRGTIPDGYFGIRNGSSNYWLSFNSSTSTFAGTNSTTAGNGCYFSLYAVYVGSATETIAAVDGDDRDGSPDTINTYDEKYTIKGNQGEDYAVYDANKTVLFYSGTADSSSDSAKYRYNLMAIEDLGWTYDKDVGGKVKPQLLTEIDTALVMATQANYQYRQSGSNTDGYQYIQVSGGGEQYIPMGSIAFSMKQDATEAKTVAVNIIVATNATEALDQTLQLSWLNLANNPTQADPTTVGTLPLPPKPKTLTGDGINNTTSVYVNDTPLANQDGDTIIDPGTGLPTFGNNYKTTYLNNDTVLVAYTFNIALPRGGSTSNPSYRTFFLHANQGTFSLAYIAAGRISADKNRNADHENDLLFGSLNSIDYVWADADTNKIITVTDSGYVQSLIVPYFGMKNNVTDPDNKYTEVLSCYTLDYRISRSVITVTDEITGRVTDKYPQLTISVTVSPPYASDISELPNDEQATIIKAIMADANINFTDNSTMDQDNTRIYADKIVIYINGIELDWEAYYASLETP